MKVYSKSIWQTLLFSVFIVPYIVMVVYMRIENGHPYNSFQNWSIVIFTLFFLITCYTSLNYIILYDDRIVMKNKIYFFWSKTYMFKDIERLIVRNDISRARIYFRFVSKGKKSRKYVFDATRDKDMQTIIEYMIEKKVNVEISDCVVISHFKNRK